MQSPSASSASSWSIDLSSVSEPFDLSSPRLPVVEPDINRYDPETQCYEEPWFVPDPSAAVREHFSIKTKSPNETYHMIRIEYVPTSLIRLRHHRASNKSAVSVLTPLRTTLPLPVSVSVPIKTSSSFSSSSSSSSKKRGILDDSDSDSDSEEDEKKDEEEEEEKEMEREKRVKCNSGGPALPLDSCQFVVVGHELIAPIQCHLLLLPRVCMDIFLAMTVNRYHCFILADRGLYTFSWFNGRQVGKILELDMIRRPTLFLAAEWESALFMMFGKEAECVLLRAGMDRCQSIKTPAGFKVTKPVISRDGNIVLLQGKVNNKADLVIVCVWDDICKTYGCIEFDLDHPRIHFQQPITHCAYADAFYVFRFIVPNQDYQKLDVFSISIQPYLFAQSNDINKCIKKTVAPFRIDPPVANLLKAESSSVVIHGRLRFKDRFLTNHLYLDARLRTNWPDGSIDVFLSHLNLHGTQPVDVIQSVACPKDNASACVGHGLHIFSSLGNDHLLLYGFSGDRCDIYYDFTKQSLKTHSVYIPCNEYFHACYWVRPSVNDYAHDLWE